MNVLVWNYYGVISVYSIATENALKCLKERITDVLPDDLRHTYHSDIMKQSSVRDMVVYIHKTKELRDSEIFKNFHISLIETL